MAEPDWIVRAVAVEAVDAVMLASKVEKRVSILWSRVWRKLVVARSFVLVRR